MTNFETIRLKFHEFWSRFTHDEKIDAKPNQKRVMTEEEMLDESLKESFPASDPPGHFSKSVEDRELH